MVLFRNLVALPFIAWLSVHHTDGLNNGLALKPPMGYNVRSTANAPIALYSMFLSLFSSFIFNLHFYLILYMYQPVAELHGQDPGHDYSQVLSKIWHDKFWM